jgi:hypothetical protein
MRQRWLLHLTDHSRRIKYTRYGYPVSGRIDEPKSDGKHNAVHDTDAHNERASNRFTDAGANRHADSGANRFAHTGSNGYADGSPD